MNVLLLTGSPRTDRIRNFLAGNADRVVEYDKPLTLDFCREHSVDYMVVHGYAPIIKEPVISEYVNKIINLHNTYLPWGRGMMGNVWSFFEDAPKGVSLHFINAGIDTGDIIVQEKVELDMDLTLKTSWDVLMDRLEVLFMDHWENIVTGEYTLVEQESTGESGSYHDSKLSNQLLSIVDRNWDTPVSVLYDLGVEYRKNPVAFEEKYNVILDPKRLK